MNWNDSLYWYWRERGGEFFSSMVWRDSGILFLDMPMGPALIQCELVPGRSGMLHREIAITLRASMEHPYYLTVRRERFSGREDEESGVFELSVRRNIRSSDPARTPYLLQNRRLQELLRAEPGAWIQINPIQEGALAHLVSVRKDAEHLEESVDSKGRAAGRDVPNQRKLYAESGFREQMDGRWRWPRPHGTGPVCGPRGAAEEMDQEARQKEYKDCGFPRQLDALVELARAARDAVTAWPMPIKTR